MVWRSLLLHDYDTFGVTIHKDFTNPSFFSDNEVGLYKLRVDL